MEKKALGLKLLELRQQHNLTQQQLCQALNIGRSTYSYFETGSRTPDIDTLLLIANYYQVTLDELLAVSSHVMPKPCHEVSSAGYSELQLIHHLKAKHIPAEDILELSKADFDFLMDYKRLSEDNKAEIQYLMNYKLRKQ